jgi:hypothetical protein
MRNFALASALFVMLSLLAVSQTTHHAFGFDDAASLHNAAAVAVSPDGKNVLYRMQFGGHKGPTNTEWNLIPAGGGDFRHLNLPEKFKPAGFTRYGTALYGLSEVDKMPQLATLPLAPPLPRGIHSAQISPDGSRYAVLADPRLPIPFLMFTPSSKPNPSASTS